MIMAPLEIVVLWQAAQQTHRSRCPQRQRDTASRPDRLQPTDW